jgi:hypothetical protein
MLTRPYESNSGRIRYIPLEICRCGDDRRGPSGGVCGRCGDAIPNPSEQQQINQAEVTDDVRP